MRAPALVTVAAVALCAAIVAWAGPGAAATPGDGTKTFKDSTVPFTFRYPDSFRQVGVSAVGIKKKLPAVALDNLNLIIVRKAGARIPDAQLRDFVAAVLKKVKAKATYLRRETHSQLRMVTARVPNTVDHKPTVSVVYFFSAAGGTWELECQSTTEQRSDLTRGCTLAIGSIKFP